MIVIVCGGRDYADSRFMWDTLNTVHAKRPIGMVVSGGADGADKLGEQWADANGVHCAVVMAMWRPHGLELDRAAGPKRNRAMLLLKPDAVIAFPGGKGTADMVKAARSAGVRIVWEPKP